MFLPIIHWVSDTTASRASVLTESVWIVFGIVSILRQLGTAKEETTYKPASFSAYMCYDQDFSRSSITMPTCLRCNCRKYSPDLCLCSSSSVPHYHDSCLRFYLSFAVVYAWFVSISIAIGTLDCNNRLQRVPHWMHVLPQ